jgi:hypothetical protein
MEKKYNVRNPLPFMELQDVQELTNFFERRVSAYQVGVQGEVAFDVVLTGGKRSGCHTGGRRGFPRRLCVSAVPTRGRPPSRNARGGR